MKKLLCVLMAAMMVLSMVVVASAEETKNYTIAVITGTMSGVASGSTEQSA